MRESVRVNPCPTCVIQLIFLVIVLVQYIRDGWLGQRLLLYPLFLRDLHHLAIVIVHQVQLLQAHLSMHNQIKVSPQLVKIVPQLPKLLKRRTKLPSNLLREHLLTRFVSLLLELSQFLLS